MLSCSGKLALLGKLSTRLSMFDCQKTKNSSAIVMWHTKMILELELLLLSKKHKDTKIFENHPNPVMLVFIG